MELNKIQYYIPSLAVILSAAYDFKYSTKVVEKRISLSPYFIALEKKYESPILFISHQKLINEFYHDLDGNYIYQLYNQTLWASELYLRIQNATNLTFEAIFLYFPIDRVYKMYPIFHEMSFEHAIREFISEINKQTVLSLLMKKYNIRISELVEISGLSPSTISSLKRGIRDINKLESIALVKIASRLMVRPETLLKIDRS